jgi:general nucleoside transport system ATP-binding protein
VMSEGRIVFEVKAAEADRKVLGAHMGGGTHHDTTESQNSTAHQPAAIV